MAQQAEHVLGKDEVTSSNLVSSSNKRSERRMRSDLFYCLDKRSVCGTAQFFKMVFKSRPKGGVLRLHPGGTLSIAGKDMRSVHRTVGKK